MNIHNNHVINDPLAVIYNEGYWRLSKVSPLFNIQSNAIKFKQYASKIRQGIITAIPAKPGVKFTVVIEAQPYLKYNEDDPEAFMINVSSQESNKSKIVFTCILLSWGVTMKVPESIHLPFMLEHGEKRIGASVKSTLQSLFDCTIKQFYFSQHQLLRFGFGFVENDTSRSTDPFTLCFSVLADHKNKLSLSFEVGDVNMIWHRAKGDSTASSKTDKLAYQILQNQIFFSMQLDVTPLDLCEINLTKAEVKSDGVVKMKTPELVNCVFTVLNEIISSQNVTNNNAVEL
ncbi:Centromere protein L [Papilio xuthus]|uniref:Centromere protein L n=1 Tax=Papilio xuthus TaxID=66420 RepID=A0A194QJI5_PAPXU|nr:Centromere protein L [Papilio xuthus]